MTALLGRARSLGTRMDARPEGSGQWLLQGPDPGGCRLPALHTPQQAGRRQQMAQRCGLPEAVSSTPPRTGPRLSSAIRRGLPRGDVRAGMARADDAGDPSGIGRESPPGGGLDQASVTEAKEIAGVGATV